MRWTEEDIAWLKRFYEAAGDRPVDLRIAEMRLKRLRSNICRKARALGLTNQRRKKRTGQAILPMNEADMPPEQLKSRRSDRARRRIRNHGHPRGMLGKKHTEEAKAAFAEGVRAKWADPESAYNSPEMKERQAAARYEQIRSGKAAKGNPYSRTKSGKRDDLGGQFFRSSWEANYARYLNLAVSAGAVIQWDYEPKTFEFEGIKRGVRFYTPDFRVLFPDGHWEWHEVKGWMDAKSKTRLKRMKKYYPDETVLVIGAEWFRLANRGVAHTIPNWERPGK